MSAIKLAAEVREGKGKGAARRLRRQGKLPGVIYAGGKEATAVAVVPKEFVKAMKGPLRRNQLLELDLPGGGRKVMVRDLQIDPIRREPSTSTSSRSTRASPSSCACRSRPRAAARPSSRAPSSPSCSATSRSACSPLRSPRRSRST
jgi:ribosomal protein L25 (general stress protein Ctc)